MRPFLAVLTLLTLTLTACASPAPPSQPPPPQPTQAVYTPPPQPTPAPTLTDAEQAQAFLLVIWGQRTPTERDQVCDYYTTSPAQAVQDIARAAQGRVTPEAVDLFLSGHCR